MINHPMIQILQDFTVLISGGSGSRGRDGGTDCGWGGRRSCGWGTARCGMSQPGMTCWARNVLKICVGIKLGQPIWKEMLFWWMFWMWSKQWSSAGCRVVLRSGFLFIWGGAWVKNLKSYCGNYQNLDHDLVIIYIYTHHTIKYQEHLPYPCFSA